MWSVAGENVIKYHSGVTATYLKEQYQGEKGTPDVTTMMRNWRGYLNSNLAE